VITLVLQQSGQGMLGGSLSSTSGMRFQVEGEVMEGTAVGLCHDGAGSGVFFEGSFRGNQLYFMLIEPDQNNMPDYSNSKTLVFTRGGGSGASAAPAGGGTMSNYTGGSGGAGTAGGVSAGTSALVGNPAWGFQFNAPPQWKFQQDVNGAILGHDTIAGFIAVLPHAAGSLAEVQAEMIGGLQEEGVYLSLISQVEQLAQNVIAGEFSGIYNNYQVRARGIGTWSPYGGGAFIVALTTPEKYGRPLAGAAETVAASLSYFPAQRPARQAPQGGGGDYAAGFYAPSADSGGYTGYDANAQWEADSAGFPGGAYDNPASTYYDYSYE
jgi:hypothetical protein